MTYARKHTLDTHLINASMVCFPGTHVSKRALQRTPIIVSVRSSRLAFLL